jgi:aminoglycoside phosphotransferase (APT) family kinase protein
MAETVGIGAMDAETAYALLGRAGFAVDPQAVQVEPREDRWAVPLPGDRMAWFPMNPEGERRLAVERRVLDLLAARCSFRAPRVLHADEAGWQLRELVPGTYDPWALYRRTQSDRALARRIGRALGGILAEQHACAGPEDVAGWLPDRLPWPEPSEALWATLPRVVTDPGLLRAIGRVLRRYEDATGATAPGDRVLLHGDLGLHNIALVPGTDEVAGVFDYDGAAWAGRHQDLRYLVFRGGVDEEMLEGALEVYEPAVGSRLDRDLILLANAAGAIGFLAFRCGTPPEARSCGRTLAEDLDWVRGALRGLGEA